MIKTKVAFWRAGFFPANQSFKTKVVFLEGWLLSSQSEQFIQKLWLAGKSGFFPTKEDNLIKTLCWAEKSPALQKSHFCYDHVNRLIVCLDSSSLRPVGFIRVIVAVDAIDAVHSCAIAPLTQLLLGRNYGTLR